MYEDVIVTVDLTSDEIDVLIKALLARLEICTSKVEEMSVRSLLGKMEV